MGLFRGKSSANQQIDPPFLFPAGVKQPITHDEITAYFTMSPERREREGLPAEDVESYLKAGYANALGVEGETIYAWGDMWFRFYGEERDEPATVVLTENSFLAWWQPRGARLIHTFQGRHGDLIGVAPRPPAMAVGWYEATLADDSGKFAVANASVLIAPKYSMDGHSNRRAMMVFHSMVDASNKFAH